MYSVIRGSLMRDKDEGARRKRVKRGAMKRLVPLHRASKPNKNRQ